MFREKCFDYGVTFQEAFSGVTNYDYQVSKMSFFTCRKYRMQDKSRCADLYLNGKEWYGRVSLFILIIITSFCLSVWLYFFDVVSCF